MRKNKVKIVDNSRLTIGENKSVVVEVVVVSYGEFGDMYECRNKS